MMSSQPTAVVKVKASPRGERRGVKAERKPWLGAAQFGANLTQRIGQALEVGWISGVAHVDVLRHQRRTKGDRGQPADQDVADFVPPEQADHRLGLETQEPRARPASSRNAARLRPAVPAARMRSSGVRVSAARISEPVNAVADAGQEVEAVTGGCQQPVEGRDAGETHAALDARDRRLRHAGLRGERSLCQSGPAAGVSQGGGRVHGAMITKVISPLPCGNSIHTNG